MHTHGMTGTRIHRIWQGMLQRCRSKNNLNYGGRGIKVCKRWLKFENFQVDMYESYVEHVAKFGEYDTTLDRKKNDGNYSKQNCRWATREMQLNNTSILRTKYVHVLTLAELKARQHSPVFRFTK